MLINASIAAWDYERPLNRFITGSWELGGIAPQDSVKATGDFITLAREWARPKGHPMPWIWVQEHGQKIGAHCHIMLHVPPPLAPLFRGKPRQWARKILGGTYVSGVIDTRNLIYANNSTLLPEAYAAELAGRVHYMLKCAPTDLEYDLDMVGASTAEWGQTGLVYGKRAGAWQGWHRHQISK